MSDETSQSQLIQNCKSIRSVINGIGQMQERYQKFSPHPYRKLVGNLWDTAWHLHRQGAVPIPPPQPENVLDPFSAKSAVDELLKWCLGLADPARRPLRIEFSLDYSSCRWGEELFAFTPYQRQAVQLLWEAKQKDTPWLGQRTILAEIESDLADSDRPRLRSLFVRGRTTHPAWGTMIVCDGKGCYSIADPPERKKSAG